MTQSPFAKPMQLKAYDAERDLRQSPITDHSKAQAASINQQISAQNVVTNQIVRSLQNQKTPAEDILGLLDTYGGVAAKSIVQGAKFNKFRKEIQNQLGKDIKYDARAQVEALVEQGYNTVSIKAEQNNDVNTAVYALNEARTIKDRKRVLGQIINKEGGLIGTVLAASQNIEFNIEGYGKARLSDNVPSWVRKEMLERIYSTTIATISQEKGDDGVPLFGDKEILHNVLIPSHEAINQDITAYELEQGVAKSKELALKRNQGFIESAQSYNGGTNNILMDEVNKRVEANPNLRKKDVLEGLLEDAFINYEAGILDQKEYWSLMQNVGTIKRNDGKTFSGPNAFQQAFPQLYNRYVEKGRTVLQSKLNLAQEQQTAKSKTTGNEFLPIFLNPEQYGYTNDAKGFQEIKSKMIEKLGDVPIELFMTQNPSIAALITRGARTEKQEHDYNTLSERQANGFLLTNNQLADLNSNDATKLRKFPGFSQAPGTDQTFETNILNYYSDTIFEQRSLTNTARELNLSPLTIQRNLTDELVHRTKLRFNHLKSQPASQGVSEGDLWTKALNDVKNSVIPTTDAETIKKAVIAMAQPGIGTEQKTVEQIGTNLTERANFFKKIENASLEDRRIALESDSAKIAEDNSTLISLEQWVKSGGAGPINDFYKEWAKNDSDHSLEHILISRALINNFIDKEGAIELAKKFNLKPQVVKELEVEPDPYKLAQEIGNQNGDIKDVTGPDAYIREARLSEESGGNPFDYYYFEEGRSPLSKDGAPIILSETKISDLLFSLQDNQHQYKNFGAYGAEYAHIYKALEDGIITGDELFNEATQKKIFQYFSTIKNEDSQSINGVTTSWIRHVEIDIDDIPAETPYYNRPNVLPGALTQLAYYS